MSTDASGYFHKCPKCDKVKPFDEENTFCGKCTTPLIKLTTSKSFKKHKHTKN
jgi:hypothetical protein